MKGSDDDDFASGGDDNGTGDQKTKKVRIVIEIDILYLERNLHRGRQKIKKEHQEQLDSNFSTMILQRISAVSIFFGLTLLQK